MPRNGRFLAGLRVDVSRPIGSFRNLTPVVWNAAVDVWRSCKTTQRGLPISARCRPKTAAGTPVWDGFDPAYRRDGSGAELDVAQIREASRYRQVLRLTTPCSRHFFLVSISIPRSTGSLRPTPVSGTKPTRFVRAFPRIRVVLTPSVSRSLHLAAPAFGPALNNSFISEN